MAVRRRNLSGGFTAGQPPRTPCLSDADSVGSGRRTVSEAGREPRCAVANEVDKGGTAGVIPARGGNRDAHGGHDLAAMIAHSRFGARHRPAGLPLLVGKATLPAVSRLRL